MVSFLLLFALMPIFIILTVLISVDGGSAFYKQLRVGRSGKEFNIYKFRSMVINADKLGGYSTKQNDERITKIGSFIRKTSLDELPQILNVLKGDMSLVGPRPNVPQQINEYSADEWQLRNSVRPGITGLAQATLRSDATQLERWMLDRKYVENFSFFLDIKIILLTVKQVFSKGGY